MKPAGDAWADNRLSADICATPLHEVGVAVIVATISAVMLAGVVGLYLHSRSRSRRRLPPYHAEDAGYVEADF